MDIFRAAREGSVPEVEYCLERGEAIEARTNTYCTPLHVAAFAEKKEVVKFLIKKGANVLAVDAFGYFPVDLTNVWYPSFCILYPVTRDALWAEKIREVALALFQMEVHVSVYVALEIIDWLPPITTRWSDKFFRAGDVSRLFKVRCIKSMYQSVQKVKAKRAIKNESRLELN